MKNLAVKPACQRQGIGSRLLGYLCRRYAKSCHTLLVGTGDTPQTTSFYRQNGFTYSHAVPDFFTANYDHPIIENGILLRDMLYFRKPLPGDSVSWLSASEIHAVLSFNTRSFLSLRLVSIVLGQQGYEKHRMGNIYKYSVHQLTAAELEAVRLRAGTDEDR